MATQNPFPFLPPQSTEQLLASFDPYVYSGTPTSLLYKFVNALVGSSGAGQLLNQNLLTQMSTALQTIYFNDLDYIFGKVNLLARSPAESYPYNPMTDMLTSAQWNEVRVKDQWYRARIKDFFKACTLGSTPAGLRMATQAAVACDAEIWEVWRYIDDYGITEPMGRAYTGSAVPDYDLAVTTTAANSSPQSVSYGYASLPPANGRNEVVIKPHKTDLSPGELRLLRDMIDRIVSVDTIVTVSMDGLAVNTPIPVSSAAADSSYFQVEQVVQATPILSKLPPPQLLPVDLLPTQTWLYAAQDTPQLAPYAAFNIGAQSGYYYLTSGGARSPIDSVTYGTLNSDGSVTTAPNYEIFDSTGQYGPLIPYQVADSPDNFPGGEYGIHPQSAPAINPDGSPYNFPYPSQEAYITQMAIQVVEMGGIANSTGYQLPVQSPAAAPRVFLPVYAIASSPPAKDSTVSTAVMATRSQANAVAESRNPVNFVRSS